MHVPPTAKTVEECASSFGVLIDDCVWYSGDTMFNIELIQKYANRSKILFHDTSISENPVHASLDQLKTLPTEIKNRMYLVHYDATKTFLANTEGFGGFVRPLARFIFD